MAKKKTDNEIIDEVLAKSTPAVAALPEEVVDEIIAAPVIEVVKEQAPKAAAKAPGMYHNGRLIEAVPARIGNKWTVIINGQREKVLKSEIEHIQ